MHPPARAACVCVCVCVCFSSHIHHMHRFALHRRVGATIVGAGCLARAAQWLKEEDAPRAAVLAEVPEGQLRNPRERAACVALGLPLPREASEATDVVVIKNLFTDAEVEHIIRTAKGLQRAHRVGDVKRDMHGNEISRATNMVWRTTYLHTNGEFTARLPEVRERLVSAIAQIDGEQHGLIAARRNAYFAKEKTGGGEKTKKETKEMAKLTGDADDLFHLRTCEFHEYWPGGQLKSQLHYDAGSFYTIDVCLASPGKDFTGGQLATPHLLAVPAGAAEDDDALGGSTHSSSPGPPSPATRRFDIVESFEKGDAAVFLSHKYHNVMPVTSGKRMVLVAELWEGPEKQCPHRCLSASPCGLSLSKVQMDGSRQHLAILG